MNKVVLMGRLTRDPELRYTASNQTAVCQFTVAVDRRFKTDGQPQADFIPVVAWRQTAEFVGKYFSKGSRIAVVGSIQTRSWDDQEGKKHYATEVIADEVEFCESKRNDSGNNLSGLTPPPAYGDKMSESASVPADYFALDEDDGDVPF